MRPEFHHDSSLHMAHQYCFSSPFILDCPAYHSYKLVLQLNHVPLLHSRFILHFSESRELFIDNSRGSRTLTRSFCSKLRRVELENLDGAEGSVRVFLGDHIILETTLAPSLLLHLTDVERVNTPYSPRSSQSVQSAKLVRTEYVLETTHRAGLLDVFVAAPVQTLLLDGEPFFTSDHPSSFLRVLRPVQLDGPTYRLTVESVTRSPLLHAALLADTTAINQALMAPSRFENMLFFTSLHHELILFNALQLAPCGNHPAFTLSHLVGTQWVTLASFPAHTTTLPIASCILSFPNTQPSSQYRFLFDDSTAITITPFFFSLPQWGDADRFTPGLFFPVYRHCFNWLLLGDREGLLPQEHLLRVDYGLFFDTANEILFGVPQPAVFASDGSLPARLSLQVCEGGLLPLHLSFLPTLPTISIYDEEELVVAIPEWLQLSNVTVCLEKDRMFTVRAKEEGELHVRSGDDWDMVVHISPNRTAFLSTHVTRPPVSYSFAYSEEEGAWQRDGNAVVPQAAALFFRLSLLDRPQRLKWHGEMVALLNIRNSDGRSITVSGLIVNGVVSEASLECAAACRLLLRFPCSAAQVVLQVFTPAQFKPGSLAFSAVLFPIASSSFFPLPLMPSPLLTSSSSLSPSIALPLPSPLLLSFASPSSLFSLPSLSFDYSTTHSLFFQLLFSSVVHTAVLPPTSPNQWTSFSISLPSSFTSSFSLVFKASHPHCRIALRHLALSTMPNVTVTFATHRGETSDESLPILARLETLSRRTPRGVHPSHASHPSQPSHMSPVSQPSSQKACEEEWDAVNQLHWKRCPAGRSMALACAEGGTVRRLCNSDGRWEPAEGQCPAATQNAPRTTVRRPRHAALSPPADAAPTTDTIGTTIGTTTSTTSTPATKPLVMCPAVSEEGLFFPSTLPGVRARVRCQLPFFGEVERRCDATGRWQAINGACSRCPHHGFPLLDETTNEMQCVQCPSGSAFIGGDPRKEVKCYGQYYSEGGMMECQLCHGVTRGTKKSGNIACKECDGVVIGMQCVKELCPDKTPIGSLRYLPCEQGMKGVVTQMCRYNKGAFGVFGPKNTEGCCLRAYLSSIIDPSLPPLGSFFAEISLQLSNLHSSVFRPKYDSNSEHRRSLAIQTIEAAVAEMLLPVSAVAVRFLSYVNGDAANGGFSTSVHLLLEGALSPAGKFQTPEDVFLFLEARRANLTLLLKERNAFVFHHYVSVAAIELEHAAENPAVCRADAEWPEVAVGTEARSLCFDAQGVHLVRRACGLHEGRAAWQAVEGACETERVSFAMRVVFEKERRREHTEERMERLNCDDVVEMRAMALEALDVDSFRRVLKQCKSEPQLVVTFFSHVPPSVELVQFFSGVAPLQRIEVVQEGAALRRSFSLVFTREEEECDNRFILCNLKGVAPNVFCHVQSGYSVERVPVVSRVWNEQRHSASHINCP